MQRALSLVVGVSAVVLAVALVASGYKKPQSVLPKDAATEATVSASDASFTSTSVEVADAGFALDPYDSPTTARPDGGVGYTMADGTPVPSLPDSAPRSVRFGVVLVTYAGAQFAPPGVRSKDMARELATKLAQEATTDFRGAVQKGDPGSSDDLGRVGRGILEPATEYSLFTLSPGGAAGPFDTPRGFWIVKRIE